VRAALAGSPDTSPLRRILPWAWRWESKGRRLTRAGQEVGREVRLSRYATDRYERAHDEASDKRGMLDQQRPSDSRSAVLGYLGSTARPFSFARRGVRTQELITCTSKLDHGIGVDLVVA